ncbi:MAG TPA: cytochrome c [Steroidobacteraceae bacterium]|nr:cytochrome c [Steroidobacteraceae bacterium]
MTPATRLLVIVTILIWTAPLARADEHPGRPVFVKWCAPCHSRGPGNPGTAALTAVYKNQKPGALEDRTDLTPEFVKKIVRNGVYVMPFFRKTEITDAELEALAAYLAQPPASE